MKRTLIVALLGLGFLLVPADARRKQPACASDIASCPKTGRSENDNHDADLNELKNKESIDEPIEDRTLRR